MLNILQAWASARGYRVAWGPGSAVAEAKQTIRTLGASGELEAGLFHSELESSLGPDPSRAGLQVVMVAMPRPAHTVGFELESSGTLLEAVLPPTYVRYRRTFEEVRQDLAAHGLPGARVALLDGPYKAVAARLGLVKYGRNNLTYVPGMGSYLQLCGYWTDAELPETALRPGPERLLECEGCEKCRRACPTGAIGPDRMLLHADRCLTYANERPGDWPAWAAGGPHRCLVGCLLCQRVCPANPRLQVEATGVTFSGEETRAILAGLPRAAPAIQQSVRTKLVQLGPDYLEPFLARNLDPLVPRSGDERVCEAMP